MFRLLIRVERRFAKLPALKRGWNRFALWVEQSSRSVDRHSVQLREEQERRYLYGRYKTSA
jgi:hypothetical protein